MELILVLEIDRDCKMSERVCKWLKAKYTFQHLTQLFDGQKPSALDLTPIKVSATQPSPE